MYHNEKVKSSNSPVPPLGQKTPKIRISPFNLEDSEESLRLIHGTMDEAVSKYYSSDVVNGLKSLYTAESLESKIEDPLTEMWIAKNRRGEISWVMSLSEYQIEAHMDHINANSNCNIGTRIPVNFNLNGFEIKTFYGTCARSFYEMLDKAKQRTLEENLTYLTGVVIQSGWNGFEKWGGNGGSLYSSKPFEVTETNKDNGEEFSFKTRYFNFIHNTTMNIQKDIAESAFLVA